MERPNAFMKDINNLNFYDKLQHFKRLISLNDRATNNTLHVSLSFDSSENFTTEKLQEIANAYMSKIGFEKQPYLVYKHSDVGHPHTIL
jgi:hypothetical protein